MKRFLSILFLLIIANGVLGQPAPASDTAKIKMPPDSVAIISIRDITNFFKWLRENVSVANYEKMKPEDTLSELINFAIKEYDKKKKK